MARFAAAQSASAITICCFAASASRSCPKRPSSGIWNCASMARSRTPALAWASNVSSPGSAASSIFARRHVPAMSAAVMRLLEAVRASRLDTRVYQASTSELFGSAPPPQSERTAFHPRSPYGVAKLYAFWATVNYREAYDMFAVNGILFNHESPRRGETFVTRKITRAVARIKAGIQERLYLGNLESTRDWGYAPEYVEGMWRMLQVSEPDDFVLATGVGATVEQFAEASFRVAGLDHREYVEVDPSYYRPAEVNYLLGDPAKAEAVLEWRATTQWDELARIMVEADVQLVQDQLAGRQVRVDR